MNNKTSYYEQSKEKLKEDIQSRYNSADGQVIVKDYYENNKESLQGQVWN